ncbi:MAG: glycosyltransferase [Pyrobaculum sp.]
MILSIITKNSYEKVGEKFAEVLDSSLQVPYRAIILVDDSDNDKTATFVKRFAESRGKELIVTRSRNYGYFEPTRATARQTAIDIFLVNFSEEWLFFLDDDFILNPGWWEEASRYTQKPRVELVWGVDYT